jgi:hypothetical protein
MPQLPPPAPVIVDRIDLSAIAEEALEPPPGCDNLDALAGSIVAPTPAA